jgi:hypothetical protein
MGKQRVLITILTGVERGSWLNPDLSLNLFQMARDSRFQVSYQPVRDKRPWDVARNHCVDLARKAAADWLLSLDNDNFVWGNPLDLLVAADKDMHVLGSDYAGGSCAGINNRNESHGYQMFSRMSPPIPNAICDGRFQEVNHLPGGVLAIRSTIWETIPGPWFVWERGGGELLTGGGCNEDIYFSNLCRRYGFKLWRYEQPAGHYKTTDATALALTLQEGKQC